MARLKHWVVAVLAALLTVVARADDLESAKAAIRVKDYETAAKLLNDNRSPGARYLLATLHLAGLGVAVDSVRAGDLLQAAAQQGEARAAYVLAGLLANEEPRDAMAAQRWLDRAAELRFAPALELQKQRLLPLAFRPQADLPDEVARREAYWQAAARNDVVALQLLSSPKWIAASDEFGRTALHRAADNGAAQAIAWLLKQGAAVEATDNFGVTPLMLAAGSAAPAALIELLKANARAAAVDSVGNAALIYASRGNRAANVAALLAAGVDPQARNKNGWSAIDYALQADAAKSVELLRARGAVARLAARATTSRSGEIARAPDRMPDLYAGWSDLAVAVTRDDPTLVQEIVNRSAVSDKHLQSESLLVIAATTQSARSASALFGKGIDPALAKGGEAALNIAVRHGDAATTQSLLAAGVSPDAHLQRASVPLFAAIRGGHEQLVRELLTAGAESNSVDEQGATPLLAAAQRGQLVAVEALLAARATVDAGDAQARTALWYAAGAGHVKIVAALLRAGAAVDAPDKLGMTPLFQACLHGRLDALEQLLAAGANVRRKSAHGDTPLMAAAAAGQLEIVRRTAAAKSELDAQNTDGDTALIFASRAGHESAVTALLQAGASTKLRNKENIAAEEIARARGFEHIAQMIDQR